MAMNGTTLGHAIRDALIASGHAVAGSDTTAIWETIGNAIVAHIAANARVASGIAVSVDPELGTGSTTGTGTIS